MALAARTRDLSCFVQDGAVLLENAIGLLKPWAVPDSSIECGLEMVSSVYKRERLNSLGAR